MSAEILVLNGPNLNLLGTREPEKYGSMRLADLEAACQALGEELGVKVRALQSNHEGVLVDAIQEAGAKGIGIVFNPGAYSHTSIAIRDAIAGSNAQVIEVHITNIHAREPFRHHSHVSPVARGVIAGLGAEGYFAALRALANTMKTAAS